MPLKVVVIALHRIETQLCEVAEIISGTVEDKAAASGQYKYCYLQPNSFDENGDTGEFSTIYKDVPIPDNQLLALNDIIIKRLNPKYPFVVTSLSEPTLISQNLFIIRPKAEIYAPYLACLFEQVGVLSQIEHLIGSMVAIKAISAKKLMGITIPLLEISRQRALGNYWLLSKKRKQLLARYIYENDRLLAVMADKLLNNGGRN